MEIPEALEVLARKYVQSYTEDGAQTTLGVDLLRMIFEKCMECQPGDISDRAAVNAIRDCPCESCPLYGHSRALASGVLLIVDRIEGGSHQKENRS